MRAMAFAGKQAQCGGLTGSWTLPRGLGKRLVGFEAWQMAPLNALKAECCGPAGEEFGENAVHAMAFAGKQGQCGGLTGSWTLLKRNFMELT